MKTRLSAFVVAGLLAAVPAWSQTPTDQQIHQLVERAKQQIAQSSSPTTPAPPAATTPADANRPVVSLTLDQAVQDTLSRNLNIAVQRLNPQTYDFSLAELRANYRPSVNSRLAAQSATTPATSQLSGGQAVSAGTQTFNAGMSQNIPWGGGSLSVNWTNSRGTTNNSFTTFNPAFNTDLLAQYTQPLLRGFSIDSTRQQLAVTKLNREISDIQLTATIANTLSAVRTAYWTLVYDVQAVAVAHDSVNLANQLVANDQAQVEVGTMAPLDVVQAQSQAANAQLALVQAEATQRTDELALKQLIVNGTNDPIWNATINPTDRPEFQPQAIDVEAAVQQALANRTDIQIAKRNLEGNNVTLKFLRNQGLPQADLVASYGTQGLGGTQFLRSSSDLGGTVTGIVPGGYSNALGSLGALNFPTWTVGLTVSYPLGTSTAEAAVANAQVEMSQTQAQMKQIELQVATDVTNAALQVQNSVEAVQAAHVATDLARKELDAEHSKFDVGMSTNYLVVQALQNYSTAENNELQATLNYRKALVTLDQVEQTTLQTSGVTVVTTSGLNSPAVGSGRPTVVAGGGN